MASFGYNLVPLKSGGLDLGRHDRVDPEIFVWNQRLVGSGRDFARMIADKEKLGFRFEWHLPISVDHMTGPVPGRSRSFC